jgi:hypothetical protein
LGEGLLFGLSWSQGSVSTEFSCGKVVKDSSIIRCLFNHVEARISFLLWVLFIIRRYFFCVVNKRPLDFLIFGYFLRILSFSGGVFVYFRSSLIFVSGVYVFVYCTCSGYFSCAGFVRISLAGRVICFLCVTPLCGVSGRYNLFEG